MIYLPEFFWTHSWDVGTLVSNNSELLTLNSNISVLPRLNLLHLKTNVSLVGYPLRPLVLGGNLRLLASFGLRCLKNAANLKIMPINSFPRLWEEF